MKSFFVIKGKPHKWFDQQGNPVESVAGIPHVKTKQEQAIGAEILIDDPNSVPVIKIWYHVQICTNEIEVKYLAEQQNII